MIFFFSVQAASEQNDEFNKLNICHFSKMWNSKLPLRDSHFIFNNFTSRGFILNALKGVQSEVKS